MSKQLMRLPNGQVVQIEPYEPYGQTPILYPQDYNMQEQRPARRRRRGTRRAHPVVSFFALLVIGFCSVAIAHPAVCFLIWGGGVVILLSALLKRD